jgi:hypothetical protein
MQQNDYRIPGSGLPFKPQLLIVAMMLWNVKLRVFLPKDAVTPQRPPLSSLL